MMLRALDTALEGVTVLELDGRLAVGLCGGLLRSLGATVVRCERTAPVFADLTPEAAARATQVVREGKRCESFARSWTSWLDRADVVLLDAKDRAELSLAAAAPQLRVVCAMSPFGIDAPEGIDAGEVELQAQGGLAAVIGEVAGPPEIIGLPVLESMAALNAATSIVAALRETHAQPQCLDIAMFDSSLALLTTFIGTVHAGKHSGYRLGAAHHLCAPWNAYPARNGWAQLCSATDDEWQRVLEVIGRGDLQGSARFASAAARVRERAEIDALISQWTRTRDAADIVAAFEAVGVSAGLVTRVADLAAGSGGRTRIAAGADNFLRCAMPHEPGHAPVLPARAAAPQHPRARALSGVRVLEIGSFTAGPLAGRYLAELGAEVIKIESPGGEVTRRWEPRTGPWSNFFVNCNIGKQFISLDLRSEAGRQQFVELAATADVLLSNLKPGALDKLGIGAGQLQARFPRLIFCGVSGFGAQGQARAALDTVIQAEAGVMSMVGDGQRPVRMGVSIADQGAAHAAPLAILAALAERERLGTGALIDLSMLDVMVWLTQLAWPNGTQPLRAWSRLQASDGFVMVSPDTPATSAPRPGGEGMTRSELVDACRSAGIRAASVLELDEVFRHPAVARRNLVTMLQHPDGPIPLLRAPHRLQANGPDYARITAGPDADRPTLMPSPQC